MSVTDLSEAKLSRRTGVPQPTLHKVLSGKTADPRVSTVQAIAQYFNISTDSLIVSSPLPENTVPTMQSIPICSWHECIAAFKKDPPPDCATVVTEYIAESAFALVAKSSMGAHYPNGSLLVVHPSLPPQDGDFLIVHIKNSEEVSMRKLAVDGPVKNLLSIYAPDGLAPIVLDKKVQVLGVVVKSIFNFH